MIRQYEESFINDVRASVIDSPIAIKVMEETDDLRSMIAEQFQAETTDTLLILATRYIYSDGIENKEFHTTTDDNRERIFQFDFEHTVPVEFFDSMAIIGKDVKKMIVMEEYLTALYSTPHLCSFYVPEYGNACFNLVISSSEKIEREGPIIIDGVIEPVYYTGIFFEKFDGFVVTKDYHPAEVAFDNNIQAEIVNRIAALQNRGMKFRKMLPPQMKTAIEIEYEPTDEELYYESESKKMLQIAETIRVSTELIPDKYSDPFYCAEIKKIISEKNCDVKEALSVLDSDYEKFKAEKEQKEQDEEKSIDKTIRKMIEEQENERSSIKEAERIQRVNLSYGDKAINCCTDVFVEKLREVIEPICKGKCYGGSTFMKCFQDEKSYPFVVVYEEGDFLENHYTFEEKRSTDIVEEKLVDNYSTFPYLFKYRIRIYYLNNESAQVALTIGEQIIQRYLEGKKLWFKSSLSEESEYSIQIAINKGKPPIQGEGSFGKWSEIYFKPAKGVYVAKDNDGALIADNPIYQLSLLKQARYYLYLEEKLNNNFELEMTSLKKRLDYYFGTNSNENRLRKALHSKNNKRIREMVENNQLIDKNLFNRVNYAIAWYYPNLFERVFEDHWDYERLYQDVKRVKDTIGERSRKICQLLGIPSEIKMFSQWENLDGYDKSTITKLIKIMESKDGKRKKMTVPEALKELDTPVRSRPVETITLEDFPDVLAEMEEDRYRREVTRREAYRESYERNGSSGSFTGTFLGTAAGVMAGNAASDFLKRNEKPDLIGSAQCNYGKMGGCTLCSLKRECKRG